MSLSLTSLLFHFRPRDITKKRENCLPWDDYFLAIGILVAKRSKCPNEQLGACIVNDDKCIVGQGYNGMPQNCADDAFPWQTDSEDNLENKFLYGKISRCISFHNSTVYSLC